MNSVPLSIGTLIHLNPKNPLLQNFQTTDPLSLVIKCSPSSSTSSLKERNPLPCLLRRREVLRSVGLSFAATLLESLFSNIEAIAEEEATPTDCDQFTVTPSGLAYCDKVVGYGPQAVKGQLIKAHYVGQLENGKVFDSSYNRGKPLTFRVGVGEVIKGWDQGILGGDGFPPMLAGGKRKLKIPPELGYGIRGAGCKGGTCIIPPDSVLLFDVEFVGKA